MDINLKLNKNFVTAYNRLQNEYGTEMASLNGFGDNQLSYTDFIDNFIDKDKDLADASIDGNANVGHKDIVTLENEMSKPHSKLLAFNKIYYEMQKKYGFKRANEWLKNEWVGNLYMHDAPSTTFRSYCVLPKECCAFILNGKKIYCSLERIYEILTENETYDEDNRTFYKIPINLQVLDYDVKNGKNRYTRVKCVSHKETDKDFYFTKIKNGSTLITTEDHPFITSEGEVGAQDLQKTDVLYSTFDESLFTNSIYEYNGLELTEDFGWLIGMYLAEGYNSKGQLSICQSMEKSPHEWNKLLEVLNNLEIPYTIYEDRGIIRLKNGNNNWERKMLKIARGKYCDEKNLCEDFIHFNDDFLKGFLSGMIDGDGTIADNRTCMIRLTSRTLINQIKLIGLHFGVYFSDNKPYIQNQKGDIKQKKPMHSANVNMNRNKDFFLSLSSRKVQEKYTHFDYNEKFANNNYVCELGETSPRDIMQTYKCCDDVYDLTTKSHSFVCNGILVHNCYAYDLESLVTEGLFFIDNFNAVPPRHLTTFTDFVGEFVSYNCNRTSGEKTTRPFASFPLISGVA